MNSIQRLRWETFLIRLRREKANGAWRGQIIHLPSRESAYFVSLAQVDSFISRFAHEIENQTTALTQEETHEEPNQDDQEIFSG